MLILIVAYQLIIPNTLEFCITIQFTVNNITGRNTKLGVVICGSSIFLDVGLSLRCLG